MPRPEKKAPAQLARVQEWFGGVIGQPLQDDSTISPLAPSGNKITEEAKRFIRPSPTLKPFERIQIYNQQYWWRLLSILHENFPLVTRLFGYHDFNKTIAIPYLYKFPPNHWSLNCLGDRLLTWIKRYYRRKDRELIYDAALLDLLYLHSFISKENPPLFMEENSAQLLSEKLFLQPSASLLEMRYQLAPFRKEMLQQDPDYWVENKFPELKKEPCRYLIFRTRKNNVAWKELSTAEYALLQQFKTGSTVDAACEWLETQSPEIRTEAETSLETWFRDWTVHGLLTLEAD